MREEKNRRGEVTRLIAKWSELNAEQKAGITTGSQLGNPKNKMTAAQARKHLWRLRPDGTVAGWQAI